MTVSVSSIQKSSLQCARHYKPLDIADAPLLQSERTASPQNLILASLGEHVIFLKLYTVFCFGWLFFLGTIFNCAQNVKIIAYVVKELIVVGS